MSTYVTKQTESRPVVVSGDPQDNGAGAGGAGLEDQDGGQRADGGPHRQTAHTAYSGDGRCTDM